MDVAGFCRQANLVVVVGKGGVGKTTVAAALARCAAATGLDVLLISLGDSGGRSRRCSARTSRSATTNRRCSPCPRRPGSVTARLLTSDAALLEYLADHGLGRVARRLVDHGVLDVISTAIPGIREILVLGKLKQLERERVADLIVLDAPATGHALSFLTSSGGLFDAARGGPLRRQAEEVLALLADPERCQVLLATIPEETPVNETVEMAYQLEDEVGVALGPLIVNECYPARPPSTPIPPGAAAEAGVAGRRTRSSHASARPPISDGRDWPSRSRRSSASPASSPSLSSASRCSRAPPSDHPSSRSSGAPSPPRSAACEPPGAGR